MFGMVEDILKEIIVHIHKVVGDYGLAIIGITILVKIALLPLTLKQDKAMKKMKEIQPEIDEIKEKYKGNQQLMNQEMMKAYQKSGASPFSGCLPVILQMPVLWALYGVLRKPMEAGGVIPLEAKFLIWELTKKDPYYILPILNGLIAFVQQKIMSKDSASNPQAEMMAKIFPVMMIVISLGLPSGLQIYWVTSSAISLLQQYFIVKKGE